MKEIIKIALTGAPCSGKTYISKFIKDKLTDDDTQVIICNESAESLIKSGVNRDNILDFEISVAENQIKQENEILKIAESSKKEKVIVIFDRGIVDCFSYLDENQKKILSRTINLDLIKAWERYDSVIFLETAAVKDNYYVYSNERTESPDKALELQDKLLDAWVGHSHLRYIKTECTINEKARKTIDEINCITNNIETEIKLLIKYPNHSFFNKYKSFECDIEQIYLLCSNGSRRIRKRGANNSFSYYETQKIRITNSKCFEYEKMIDEDDYNELKKLSDPKKSPVIKKRNCFLFDNQYFELDIYPFSVDKAILELEIKNEEQKYFLPPEIEVIKDVTNDKKYKNNYIAGILHENNCTDIL